MQADIVISCPRSADVIDPICLTPLGPTTFDGLFWTVVMPVSSWFHILSGGIGPKRL